jgi:hypothetical protein
MNENPSSTHEAIRIADSDSFVDGPYVFFF